MLDPYHTDERDTAFVKGLKHRAHLVCDQCNGSGRVYVNGPDLSAVYDCEKCGATGHVDVGCGGDAERDMNYPTQAYCIAEDTFVPSREVPWPEDKE